ncbi:MAG: META domain-containing protein [Muribaculaceae bacterium]|nr:META domain-containing protein [Muribaculaceae bacterium]
MKKILIVVMSLALLMVPLDATARKKKKKTNDKQKVELEQPATAPAVEQNVVITDPNSQLYGEWNLWQLRKKDVNTQERAYIYLDFANHQFYGNNGCNAVNGHFSLAANGVISFNNVITTTGTCHNVTREKDVMKALSEVQRFHVTRKFGMDYLHLTNAKGNPLLVLKRQNLDFLNGAWQVKEVDGKLVSEHNVRLVVDAEMQTIHGDTGCNIINGVITLDPSKDMAIQFEDLQSGEHDCEAIDYETALLLALERTESCKRINQNEMALLDNKGAIVIVLQRINLRQ